MPWGLVGEHIQTSCCDNTQLNIQSAGSHKSVEEWQRSRSRHKGKLLRQFLKSGPE